MSVPQPPIPMASSHPISNDRISGSHKRPRLDRGAAVPQSRSPPDDYSYHPSPISFSRGQQPGGYSQHGPRGSSHHQHHPTSSSQYAPFFPGSGHTPPPPSFIPLQSDFNPPPRSSTRSSGFGPPPPPKSARVVPVMIAECTPTTNCARVLPVAGVVEVVVEADKAIFLLLLWTGTNVQGVGDPALVERDWTGLSMDQVRMHLIQVSIPHSLGH